MPPRLAVRVVAVLVSLLAAAPLAAAPLAAAPPADLIVTAAPGGRVWTGEAQRPWAEAVAVVGQRIVAVGSAAEVAAYRGPGTRVIDAAGRFVLPGFIDNHTHFDRAGALLLGVNLLDVHDEAGLAARVREAQERLPAGAWIVGGDWGAYEAWGQGSAGEGGEGAGSAAGAGEAVPRPPFRPHRRMIDPFTRGRNPVLLSKWDGSLFLANAEALSRLGLTCEDDGVDCEGGEPTGLLSSAAAARVRQAIPEKPLEQRLAEARVALERLRRHGVTGIHDITPPEQLVAFQELRRRGELTVRVYARPTLDRWQHLAALGIRHGFGDEWVKIGGLKGFVDGIMGNSSARFYEPYLTSGERGSWREMMKPEGRMLELLTGADAAGHWPQVHAIGDEAIDHLLDLYQQVIETNGERERRLRVIHAQVIRDAAVAKRMAAMGVVAEVQPYHAIDDMRWMEERIGARSRWAYAFKTLADAGVRLSFGSDWPGTNASWYPSSPLLGIYAAVTRQTLDGEPAGGWFPEERVDLETALRAYTVNNAWAAGEEAEKGSLAPGKLADIVVLDRDPFAVAPAALKDLQVLWTVLGGEVVYARDVSTPAEAAYRDLLAAGVASGFPGFVLAVDRPGRPLWVGAAGQADLAGGVPLTPEHAFHYASVTKLFTAVAALRLADRGQLDLDQPLLQRLPDEPAVAALPHAGRVRVRQLLDHASGFFATNNDPAYIEAWLGPQAGAASAWGPRDFLRLAAKGEPFAEPGEGHGHEHEGEEGHGHGEGSGS